MTFLHCKLPRGFSTFIFLSTQSVAEISATQQRRGMGPRKVGADDGGTCVNAEPIWYWQIWRRDIFACQREYRIGLDLVMLQDERRGFNWGGCTHSRCQLRDRKVEGFGIRLPVCLTIRTQHRNNLPRFFLSCGQVVNLSGQPMEVDNDTIDA